MEWSAPLHSDGLEGQNDGVFNNHGADQWKTLHESGLIWGSRCSI